MAMLEKLDPISQDFDDKLEHIRGAVAHLMYQEEGTWFIELAQKGTARRSRPSDEILRSLDAARNQFVWIEHLTDAQICQIRDALEKDIQRADKEGDSRGSPSGKAVAIPLIWQADFEDQRRRVRLDERRLRRMYSRQLERQFCRRLTSTPPSQATRLADSHQRDDHMERQGSRPSKPRSSRFNAL